MKLEGGSDLPYDANLEGMTVEQCFPNCVPRHTGVPLKCTAKVFCFDKTLCCKSCEK